MKSREFNYKHTAPTEVERKEIESIRRQYTEPDTKQESKLEKLRRLDAKVKNTPTIVALVLGVVGCLIFGLGLTTILEWKQMLLGAIVMAVGTVPMIFAYPAYKFTFKRYKKKYGAEIVSLSESLLNGEE